MIFIVYFQRYHIELAQTVINFTLTLQHSFHWTSANFSSVTSAMQEKPPRVLGTLKSICHSRKSPLTLNNLNLNCFSTNPDDSFQTTESKSGGVAETMMNEVIVRPSQKARA